MWATIIVDQPGVEVGLQLVNGVIDLLAEATKMRVPLLRAYTTRPGRARAVFSAPKPDTIS
jgi:hypothetical protein